MRFTSLLLSLPLLGSALAAPLVPTALAPAPIVYRDGPLAGDDKSAALLVRQDAIADKMPEEVLTIVQDLKTTVFSAVLGVDPTDELQVQTALQTALDALNIAYAELGVDVDAEGLANRPADPRAKRQLLPIPDALLNLIAAELADVVLLINTLLSRLPAALAGLPLIAGLIAALNPALATVLLGVNILLAGVLQLVGALLAALGVVLSPLLGGVLGILGPLLGGILG